MKRDELGCSTYQCTPLIEAMRHRMSVRAASLRLAEGHSESSSTGLVTFVRPSKCGLVAGLPA